MQAAEARLAELGYHLCPHCDYEVEKDFLRCPNCMRKLKDPCPVCSKPLDPAWKICPFCEADLGSAAPTPRRARRRRDGTLERPVAGASGLTAEGPIAGATGFVEGSTPPPATRGGSAGT
jgi:predicted amidophosphoribosyltransferase